VNSGFRLKVRRASKVLDFGHTRVRFVFGFGRDLLHWLRLRVSMLIVWI
jgi:hypothetical protein